MPEPIRRFCAHCEKPIKRPQRTRSACSMACRNILKRGQPSARRKTWDDYPPPIRDVNTGCLRWQGPHNPSGYGRLGKKYAHREAWVRAGNTIPPRMTIDHVYNRGCRYKDCVEVSHLEVVTQKTNVHRSEKCKRQMAKTHCPQGHPYSGHNLIVKKSGKRECRECGRIRARRRRVAG